MYEKKIVELIKQVEYEESRSADFEGQLMEMRQCLSDSKRSIQVMHKFEHVRFFSFLILSHIKTKWIWLSGFLFLIYFFCMQYYEYVL